MKKILVLIGVVSVFLLSFSIEKRPDIKVAKNETFTVELNYVAGTGYNWVWSNPDTVNFDSVSVEYKRDNNLIGGAGTMIWTFVTKEQGDFSLVFDYKRAWESTSIEQKTFSVRVK